ncbi:hypothetical protein GCM10009818_22030 [Nakamurella flavida]
MTRTDARFRWASCVRHPGVPRPDRFDTSEITAPPPGSVRTRAAERTGRAGQDPVISTAAVYARVVTTPSPVPVIRTVRYRPLSAFTGV